MLEELQVPHHLGQRYGEFLARSAIMRQEALTAAPCHAQFSSTCADQRLAISCSCDSHERSTSKAAGRAKSCDITKATYVRWTDEQTYQGYFGRTTPVLILLHGKGNLYNPVAICFFFTTKACLRQPLREWQSLSLNGPLRTEASRMAISWFISAKNIEQDLSLCLFAQYCHCWACQLVQAATSR